jgi:hypothetical protein
MSWAEDEGIDGWSVTDFETEDYLHNNRLRQYEWENGFHTDKDGNEIPLTEMSERHLKNTIKYFAGLDTSALEAELVRREGISLINIIN